MCLKTKVGPGLRRHRGDLREIHRMLIGRIESEPERPFEQRQVRENGLLRMVGPFAQEARHRSAEPAHIPEHGRMRCDVIGRDGREPFVAGEGLEDRVVVPQHFDEPEPVSVAIDVQPGVAERVGIANDLPGDAGVDSKHVALERGLGQRQAAHAATDSACRTVAAMRRA